VLVTPVAVSQTLRHCNCPIEGANCGKTSVVEDAVVAGKAS
jgi:hypothetical protein